MEALGQLPLVCNHGFGETTLRLHSGASGKGVRETIERCWPFCGYTHGRLLPAMIKMPRTWRIRHELPRELFVGALHDKFCGRASFSENYEGHEWGSWPAVDVRRDARRRWMDSLPLQRYSLGRAMDFSEEMSDQLTANRLLELSATERRYQQLGALSSCMTSHAIRVVL